MGENPFDSIESAKEYVRLLISEAADARNDIQVDIAEAVRDRATRRVDALHLVDYKLKQLDHHLCASARILNDLRLLRRLLDDAPEALAALAGESGSSLRVSGP
jgi:hypothetical protein